jgi:hypothetical protein
MRGEIDALRPLCEQIRQMQEREPDVGLEGEL